MNMQKIIKQYYCVTKTIHAITPPHQIPTPRAIQLSFLLIYFIFLKYNETSDVFNLDSYRFPIMSISCKDMNSFLYNLALFSRADNCTVCFLHRLL